MCGFGNIWQTYTNGKCTSASKKDYRGLQTHAMPHGTTKSQGNLKFHKLFINIKIQTTAMEVKKKKKEHSNKVFFFNKHKKRKKKNTK